MPQPESVTVSTACPSSTRALSSMRSSFSVCAIAFSSSASIATASRS